MRTPFVVASIVVVAVACGRGAASPAAGECDLKTTGPLVGYSYDVTPQPAATGGAIEDGVYDLVKIIDHGKASGPESSDQAPAFRWALRFMADDHSPSHVEGRLLSAIDLPPANGCDDGRFATVGTELRAVSKKPKIETEPYSATPDGFVVLSKGTTYVFHRR